MSAFAKIAVGVDFSPESDRAVEHALAAARRTGASLTLVHACAVPPGTPDERWHEVAGEQLVARKARLAALRERLAGRGGLVVDHAVVDDYPDAGLVAAARDMRADLIVVGTHGRTGVRRLLLGSVAEHTARLAEASVLVARGAAPAAGYPRVVVGTDFSPLADRALARAFELTAEGGEVEVVHAWAAPYVEYDLDGRMYEMLREAAVHEVEVQRARLLARPRPPGVRLTVELVDGVTFTALEARSQAADLVVVGSHGRRGLRRFVLGSVAEATIRHAHCSVLVAR